MCAIIPNVKKQSRDTQMERENTMGKTKLFLYRQRFGYGLGDFACNLIWQMISLYLLYFYTDVMKLNAGAVAVMFLVCRVIDAITDSRCII